MRLTISRFKGARRATLPTAFVLALGVGLAWSHPSSAQSKSPSLAALELQYQAAVESYEAALAARQVVESQWRAALDSVSLARNSGDQPRFDQASSAFLLRSDEFDRLDARVQEAGLSVAQYRADLLSAIESEVEQLAARAGGSTDADLRTSLATLARDLQNQYRDLLAEQNENLIPTPVFYPGSLAYNPRDTPDLLQAKAQLVERRIASVQAQLAESDDRINDLERLNRLRRQQGNFNAPLDRFGDVQLPVVTGGQGTGQVEVVGDSTGLQPPSLEEQLASWRLQKAQLLVLLEQLEENLRRFKSRLGTQTEGA